MLTVPQRLSTYRLTTLLTSEHLWFDKIASGDTAKFHRATDGKKTYFSTWNEKWQ